MEEALRVSASFPIFSLLASLMGLFPWRSLPIFWLRTENAVGLISPLIVHMNPVVPELRPDVLIDRSNIVLLLFHKKGAAYYQQSLLGKRARRR